MATLYANTYNLKLAFTTWCCPEWTPAAIVDGMQTYGYEGVELRLGKGHLHGVEIDAVPTYLSEVRKQFDAANMAVSCLATSYTFSSPDIVERQKTISGVKQVLRLADSLGAPYVRVYGGEVTHGLEVTGVVDYIAEALDECTEFAEKEKLRSMVLLETHDTFSHSKFIKEVLDQVYSAKLGVLWDVLQPMRVLESVEDTYDIICDKVKHIHIHDFTYNDDRTRIQSCDPGEGFVPLPQVIDLLKSYNFRGYLAVDVVQQSPDPDEILPRYSKYLKKLIKPEK